MRRTPRPSPEMTSSRLQPQPLTHLRHRPAALRLAHQHRPSSPPSPPPPSPSLFEATCHSPSVETRLSVELFSAFDFFTKVSNNHCRMSAIPFTICLAALISRQIQTQSTIGMQITSTIKPTTIQSPISITDPFEKLPPISHEPKISRRSRPAKSLRGSHQH